MATPPPTPYQPAKPSFPARPSHRDGNCLAGPLSEIFARDVMDARRRCPHCQVDAPLAALHVFGPEPGITARCPGCAAVALRMVRHGELIWLELGSPDGPFRIATGDRP
ncbi:DUF6510 family protein [Streptomyces radicis]|uniref:DUF6510 family protein n=1 Tax=Streptomyces radicis TaxID=1750517 RepID=UPI001E571D39|nr:DUF6510 family protein [Streptomyces radicis]